MKKEHFLIVAVSLFVLAYVLDFVAGPVSFNIKTPFSFLDPLIIGKYPLTTVAIGARTLAITISIVLFLSLLGGFYFSKAVTVIFLGVMFGLYGIQQVATGTRTTTIQWTLSLVYAGVFLLVPTVYYTIRGLVEKGKAKGTAILERRKEGSEERGEDREE